MDSAASKGPSVTWRKERHCRRRRTIVTTLVASASLIALSLQVGTEAIAASAAVVVGVWWIRHWRRRPCQ